ncbi:hypothetical protein [Oleiharenicola sp. Vm1]|uniref:hypothetical protein n=1 Tax=Oleiharenicola sp. Vm1 TaxID=3398393 RepID=UPI0039F58A50
MKNVVEIHRLAAPFPKPQALYVDGPTLWVSSRTTRKLYTVDRATMQVTWETSAPGAVTPWGVTKMAGDIYAVLGTDADGVDDRTIGRCIPGRGFDPAFSWNCPDRLGSHLSFDGQSLVLSQWYGQKLCAFDAAGQVRRTWPAPHPVPGHCFAQGAFWLLTVEDEESDDYWITRLDPKTGRSEDVARVGFSARALAFDGTHFWTNHREANQIVCFALPS